MADDMIKPATQAPKGRKYTYQGKAYRNPKVFNTYGALRIRPWDMTDEEIDRVLRIRPDLTRLWRTNGDGK